MTTEKKITVRDSIVTPLLEEFDTLLSKKIPSSYRIWQAAQQYLAAGDTENAEKCQALNYVLHNSYVPNAVRLGEDVQFGYGGIGLVIHERSDIRKGVVIGANVTLGGRAGGGRFDEDGKVLNFPRIMDYAYIATGSKILGGVTVGALSIVGPNSVVVSDVEPLTIVGGIPAKPIKRVTRDNCLRYKPNYLSLRKMSDEEFIELVILHEGK